MSTSTNYDPKKIVIGYPFNPVTPTTPAATNHNDPEHANPSVEEPPPCMVVALFLGLPILVFFGFLFLVIHFAEVPGPKNPCFLVDSVVIPSFNSSSQATMDFVVNNPNKDRGDDGHYFVFDPTNVTMLCHNEFLGGTMIEAFSLGNGNETKISVNFVIPGTALNKFYSDNFGNQILGEVSFDFKLRGALHVSDHGTVSLLDVLCKDVFVGFSQSTGIGTLSRGPKKCRVHWE